jgi:hypothetical protein
MVGLKLDVAACTDAAVVWQADLRRQPGVGHYGHDGFPSLIVMNGGKSSLAARNRQRLQEGRYRYQRRRLGFRVASIPEPGSIVLVVAGELRLLAYVWQRRPR